MCGGAGFDRLVLFEVRDAAPLAFIKLVVQTGFFFRQGLRLLRVGYFAVVKLRLCGTPLRFNLQFYVCALLHGDEIQLPVDAVVESGDHSAS